MCSEVNMMQPVEHRRRVLVLAVWVAAAGMVTTGRFGEGLGAQEAAVPTFEVASVKPNKSGEPMIRFGLLPGGRFNAVNVPARQLIVFAYAPLQAFQIEGGPGWINSDRFDVTAKAEGNVPPAAPNQPGPIPMMMRALLAERFKLKVHTETKEMPTYALVLARSDGRLGPGIRAITPECAELIAGRARGVGPAGRVGGPPSGPPPAPPGPGERAPCGTMFMGIGNLASGGVTLSDFGRTLSQRVGRVVVDRTGITGLYDFTLTFAPEQLPLGGPGGPAGPAGPGGAAIGSGVPPGALLNGVDPNAPSLFTALQEQLGLKLEATRGPVEMLIIDSIEQPTPD
jgi:uncharacterized protein (TIGR03435 family)